jgi:hypothetical protein
LIDRSTSDKAILTALAAVSFCEGTLNFDSSNKNRVISLQTVYRLLSNTERKQPRPKELVGSYVPPSLIRSSSLCCCCCCCCCCFCVIVTLNASQAVGGVTLRPALFNKHFESVFTETAKLKAVGITFVDGLVGPSRST